MSDLPRHLVALCERLAVDVVLDVGANEGLWALDLRRAGYRGRIVSFEPCTPAFETLRRRAEGDPAWQVRRLALGREDGELVVHRTRSSVFASALPPSRFARALFPDEVAVEEDERVPQRRLDGVLRDVVPDLVAPRCFLKLDTQGFDLAVFEGAAAIADAIVGLQAELSVLPLYDGAPRWAEAIATYAAAGFSPSAFFPLLRAPRHLVLCEFDCVLARHAPVVAVRPSHERPPVSVVVTACDDSPPLRACLESVAKQARTVGGEVLLVVNAAPGALSAETRTALAALCDRVLFEPRVGKSHALNAAVRACRGVVVAFTDDDAEPEPGWLEALARPLLAADRDPMLVGVGGPVEPVFERDTPAWFRAMVMKKATHFLGPRHDLGPEARDYSIVPDERTGVPLGANCAYRREVFESYFFDPTLGPNRDTGLRGGEDTLLARSLLHDGYRLRYCPEARVRHPVHASRATDAYVLRGHYVQGVEWARMQRALRQPLPPLARLRFERWRMQLRLLRKRITGRADADRRRHILAKAEFRRGLLEEARRGRGVSGAPPG